MDLLLEALFVFVKVICVKLEIDGVVMNVISVYAPQVSCYKEEKEEFWRELDEVVLQVPIKERTILGADFNGHVGEGNSGDEELMGRKILGVTSGQKKIDKETWWWNEEVQESLREKRLAKKNWHLQQDEESRQKYKEMCGKTKRAVAKAKEKAYSNLYEKLNTKEGEKDLFRLAKQRNRDVQDVQQVRMINDKDGNVLSSEESVLGRWKEYLGN
ncbi:uncharacterized protein LOC136082952 [Hydra vulgaris]|uniref:Uncharacterized protein LOC136082952 n=1 Tax=Hydra vulgaris TaxID=6087 RepID=A0ABM4C9V2_HYDVU